MEKNKIASGLEDTLIVIIKSEEHREKNHKKIGENL